ncbi:hypothetical protein BH11PSE11_BH11PSE11_17620 [soil metagenome]
MRPSRHLVLVTAISILLGGCATPEQRAADLEREVAQMMQIYAPACEHLGFQRNTDAWRNCILNLNANDEMKRNRSFADPFPPYSPLLDLPRLHGRRAH